MAQGEREILRTRSRCSRLTKAMPLRSDGARLGPWICAAAVFLLASREARPATAPTVGGDWPAKWREDLQFLARKLPETHPNAFHTMPRSKFEEEIRQLSDRAASSSHAELAAGLARIVAGIGEGHTRKEARAQRPGVAEALRKASEREDRP
jgi:hypothetical protein